MLLPLNSQDDLGWSVGVQPAGPQDSELPACEILYPHVSQGWQARSWEGDRQGAPRGHKSHLLPARGMGGRCSLMPFKENSCNIFYTSEFVAAIHTCYTHTPECLNTPHTHT